MLKTLRAEIQRTADQLRERYDDSLTVVVVGIVGGRAGEPVNIPCAGYACTYYLAGERRRLYFPGTDHQAEAAARALIDHAHKLERIGDCRPAAVLMQQETPPDNALTIHQPPEGLHMAEHVARLYDALARLAA